MGLILSGRILGIRKVFFHLPSSSRIHHLNIVHFIIYILWSITTYIVKFPKPRVNILSIKCRCLTILRSLSNPFSLYVIVIIYIPSAYLKNVTRNGPWFIHSEFIHILENLRGENRVVHFFRYLVFLLLFFHCPYSKFPCFIS